MTVSYTHLDVYKRQALRQQMISRTTAATELAAAASVPMCPINVEYDVKPMPHTRLAPRIGPEHLIKSADSSLLDVYKRQARMRPERFP